MKRISVANRNIIILILSLLPFILGIGFSLVKSSDMAYFGIAINISGSQRMRTMLIANYAQQIEDYRSEGDEAALKSSELLLNDELLIYERYMEALVYGGDDDLMMKANEYHEIVDQLLALKPQYESYVESANRVLAGDEDSQYVDFLVQNSLGLKNKIHDVVEAYQYYYDQDIHIQKMLDIAMIVIATLVTVGGLLLTKLIKRHEHHANYDYLTKLQNRYFLYEFIKHKSVKEYAVFFIDLNKFKVINDTFGHHVGDEILIEVARRLKGVFGEDFFCIAMVVMSLLPCSTVIQQ